jgi:NADH-quinone oxidoreductase subunit E
MSVRRLDPIQPENFAFTPTNLVWAKEAIAKYPAGKQASAVIPVLWRAQEQIGGWITRPAMEYVAKMLDMSFIRIYEIATFYTMFQLSPVGRKAHVQLCGTTPCVLRGAEDLKEVCRRRIHPEPHHLSADGNLSWEEVECLGACVNAPMVLISRDTYEDLTPESFERVLDEIAAGRQPRAGPQIDRQFSAPVGGPTTLTDPSLYNGGAKVEQIEPPTPTAIVWPSAVVATDNAADGAKPAMLAAARGGNGDDLKLIWGVGPKLETLLHDMGVWHFDQIAAWTNAELAWVDARLEGFKGRAIRDEWVEQAKKLASGWRPDRSVGEKPGKH